MICVLVAANSSLASQFAPDLEYPKPKPDRSLDFNADSDTETESTDGKQENKD